MSNLGESFTYPDNSFSRIWYTSPFPVPESNTDYNDKTVLFSCVDIDRGWDWLYTLKSLYDVIHADADLQDVVAVAAIIFKYGGSVNPTSLRSTIAADTTLKTIGSGDDFYIIADKAWSGSFSQTRQSDFAGDIDTASDNVYWNYIIGRNSVASGENTNPIMDIWSHGTGTMTLYDTIKQEFDSAVAADMQNYVTGRLHNLTSPARLVCPDPPDGTWLRSLTSLTLYFTKPVRQSQVQNASNWAFSGGGSDSLSFASASPLPVYDKTGNLHSIVTMTLNNGIRDSQADKDVTLSAENIQDIYGNDAEPETVGGTVIKSPVTWSIDLTGPAVDTFEHSGPDCVNTLTAGWTLEASDNPGGGTGPTSGIAFRCVKTNPTAPNPDIPDPWTVYDGSEITGSTALTDQDDGIQAVYAWVKDAAGNVSSRHDLTFTLDRTKPKITSFSVPDYANSTTVTVTIGAFDETSGIAAWAVTESSTAPAAGAVGVWKTSGIADPSFSVNVTLSTGDGEKTLYAWVKDAAGNVSALNNEIDGSAVQTSDTVLLDTKSPVINSVTVTSYPRTDNRTVTFTVNASDPADPGVTDVSGVYQVKFSNTDTGGTWQSWTGSAQVFTHQLPDPHADPDHWGPCEFNVWVRDRAGNTSTAFPASVTLQRPREFYLVLDYSGSMLGDTPWEGEDTPKIDILQSCVNCLVELSSLWDPAGENDRIGVIKFHNTVFPVAFNGNQTGKLLQNVDQQNTSTLETIAASLDEGCESGNLTGMGAGLAEALHRLAYGETDEAHGSRRAVFLISDGIQNLLPFVKATGSGTGHSVLIDNTNPEGLRVAGNTGYGNIPVEFNQTGAGGKLCYPWIYTLGIGTYAHWQETLEKTAAAGGGAWIANPEALTAVENFFNTALPLIYQGNSPQLIFSARRDYTPGGGTGERTFRFIVNKSVSSLAIKLVWGGGTDLTFMLWKDNVRVGRFDKNGSGFGYEVTVLRFPHREVHFYPPFEGAPFGKGEKTPYDTLSIPFYTQVEPEGEWKIQICPRGTNTAVQTIPYCLSVFVEEKELEFDFSGIPSVITAGETLTFNVDIFEHHKPLKSQYSVLSTVRKPKTPPGNLLSQFQPPNFEALYRKELKTRQISRAEYKTELLLRDPELRRRAQEVEIEVVPCVSLWKTAGGKRKEARKPRFRGATRNTKTPGIYQVELDIRGTGKLSGSFQRKITRSILVRFKVHGEKTLKTLRVQTAGKNIAISIVPTDGEGNLLGPGWDSMVSLTIGKKQLYPEDRMDGVYEYLIPKADLQKPSGKKLSLSVMDRVLFEGTLEDLGKAGKP
ncbi:MAG: VWA domain-containing protein, partial [Spirochaetales bacterium]|nr:VWA domain-containing protein [Spirochaetales bacterium]